MGLILAFLYPPCFKLRRYPVKFLPTCIPSWNKGDATLCRIASFFDSAILVACAKSCQLKSDRLYFFI